GGLVEVFRSVGEIAVLAMFDPWENLALGGSVALEFVGNDHARHVGQPSEQLAKEFLRGLLVPTALDQDIQHVAVLIDHPPQIVTFALDGQKHFIEMPFVTRPRTATAQLIGILLAKFATPLADRLIGHDDSAFKQELFDITKAQTESEVEPDGVADDLHRKAVVLILLRGGGGVTA